MFYKLIICSVAPAQRDAFSTAQESWSQLSRLDGFVTQVGGWDRAGACAVITGVWKHVHAYRRFMTEVHDEVYADSRQAETLEQVRTALFDGVFEPPRPGRLVGDARGLTATVVTVAINQQARLLQALQQLAGTSVVARAHDRAEQFIVLSPWTDRVAGDVRLADGGAAEHESWTVDLVEAWTVRAS